MVVGEEKAEAGPQIGDVGFCPPDLGADSVQ